MEVVTANELAAYFDKLTAVIEGLGAQLRTREATETAKAHLTRVEAAEYLRLSVPQLDVLARQGRISRAKMGPDQGSRVLYRRKDLDKYVEECMESVASVDTADEPS